MRILVTNDDGIAAPGLKVAEAVAAEIAGPEGEVWTVAPAFEQSGVSHAITYNAAIQAEQLSERRFAVSGAPADCVILAVHAFMKDALPDLVISGVNRGHNVAEDAVYSGTLGGAIEAAVQGFRGIALSQYYRRPPLAGAPPIDPPYGPAPADPFDAARQLGVAAVRALLAEDWPKDLFYNVNFPPTAPEAAKGVRFTKQGRRTRGGFDAEERTSPGGRRYFWLRHMLDNASAGPDTDSALCREGWVTIVPMRADYTDVVALDRLSQAQPPL